MNAPDKITSRRTWTRSALVTLGVMTLAASAPAVAFADDRAADGPPTMTTADEPLDEGEDGETIEDDGGGEAPDENGGGEPIDEGGGGEPIEEDDGSEAPEQSPDPEETIEEKPDENPEAKPDETPAKPADDPESLALTTDLYVNDAAPEEPTGKTADGSSSHAADGPQEVEPGSRVDLTFVVTNVGDALLEKVTISGPDGQILDDSRGSDFVAGDTRTYNLEIDAGEAGTTSSDGYTVTASNPKAKPTEASSELTVELAVTDDVKPTETTTPEPTATTPGTPVAPAPTETPTPTAPPAPTVPVEQTVALTSDLYVNDANPSEPTGVTADGTSSVAANGPHRTSAEAPVQLSFVVTNTGTAPIDLVQISGPGGVIAEKSFGEGDLAPGGVVSWVLEDEPVGPNGSRSTDYTVTVSSTTADPSTATATHTVDLLGADVTAGIEVTTFANDADPEAPTGTTPDGQDSTGPITVPADTDVPVSMRILNTGTASIERLVITGSDGEVVSDDVFEGGEGGDPFPAEGSWIYSTTIDAATIAGNWNETYSLTAYTTAGEATGTGTFSISTPEAVLEPRVTLDTYVDDADPTSPTGVTPEGADSSGDHVAVPVDPLADATISFVVTNTGTAPLTSLTLSAVGDPAVVLNDDVLDAPLLPGESMVYTTVLSHSSFEETLSAGGYWTWDYVIEAGVTDERSVRDRAVDDDSVWLTASYIPDDDGTLARTGASFPMLAGSTAAALLLGAAGLTLLARRRQAQR